MIRHSVEQREVWWTEIAGATVTRLRIEALKGIEYIGKDGENLADDGLWVHGRGGSYYA